MKKIDQLLIKSFLKPFLGTFLVVVFIFFMQFFLVFFDEFAGKGLGWWVYSQLFFYFSINTTPIAFPLAILLSSLITFGNLSEHFELIALKNIGISLYRILWPLFLLVCCLMGIAFVSNNYVVPQSNVKAYRLLYDMRRKKPAVNIKEGVFYKGIPGYTIKIKKKTKDLLNNIIIYGYDEQACNNNITLAKQGKIYTQGNHLVMELYDGSHYMIEKEDGCAIQKLYQSNFQKNQMTFDLSSLALQETEEMWFKNNKKMQTLHHLTQAIQEQKIQIVQLTKKNIYQGFWKEDSSPINNENLLPADTTTLYHQLSSQHLPDQNLWKNSLSLVQSMQSKLFKYQKSYQKIQEKFTDFTIEKQNRWAITLCCLLMFLIGAPTGVIIKKGGLGAPMIFSIFFYLCYYILDIIGNQYAKQHLIDIRLGVWLPHLILFPIGLLIFLQARKDHFSFHLMWIVNLISSIKKIKIRKK